MTVCTGLTEGVSASWYMGIGIEMSGAASAVVLVFECLGLSLFALLARATRICTEFRPAIYRSIPGLPSWSPIVDHRGLPRGAYIRIRSGSDKVGPIGALHIYAQDASEVAGNLEFLQVIACPGLDECSKMPSDAYPRTKTAHQHQLGTQNSVLEARQRTMGGFRVAVNDLPGSPELDKLTQEDRGQRAALTWCPHRHLSETRSGKDDPESCAEPGKPRRWCGWSRMRESPTDHFRINVGSGARFPFSVFRTAYSHNRVFKNKEQYSLAILAPISSVTGDRRGTMIQKFGRERSEKL
ncbi:hypothetical protein EDB89DRAFT_1908819 [Lactarius sanguifluus]|nr:hypothetical protein EDB89DRAFT_1908819 [Lactarius sanguifluus]